MKEEIRDVTRSTQPPIYSTNPSKARDIGQLSGQSSTLLFIYPIRRKGDLDYGDSMLAIPTMHLSEIFDSKCQSFPAMKLFEALSTHALTRGPAGWRHEQNLHIQMLTDGKRYEIFKGDNKSIIASAPPGLVGTASTLRDAVRNGLLPFYWFPYHWHFVTVTDKKVSRRSM